MDREALIKGYNLSDSEYPMVVIKDRGISRELKGFLGIRFSVEKIFGQILGQLGFDRDDIIVLKNIEYNRGMNLVRFDYSVNSVDNPNNKMVLNFNYYGQLFVYGNDIDIVCECSCTSYNDFRVYLRKITEKIDGDKKYTRKYGFTCSEYIVNNSSDEVRLILRKDNDNDYTELMCIKWDFLLERYFKNLGCSYDIDSLYKEICGYLGDIDSYKEVRLEINKKINNKNVNIGLLLLENGICKEFMITRGDKCIYLNYNGEWSYNFNGRFYNISSLGIDDKNVIYSITGDNDSVLKYAMDRVNIDEVATEVEDTKKLVRSMFNKNKK